MSWRTVFLTVFIGFACVPVRAEGATLFDPDGFIWEKNVEGFNMGYIAGYVRAKSDTFVEAVYSTESLVDKLKKENAISKSFSNTELDKIKTASIKRVMEESFDNIPFIQLYEGVDKFYKESSNKKISVPKALDIVKLKIKGEKEDFVKCMTEYSRMYASETDKLSEKINKKFGDCLELRKK